jgi:rhodanese-related sulfurtransferase/DNA-binding transcriptional ArsR family regulator
MTLEDLPDRLYEQFARMGKALSDPTRLRVLNLLCQTERGVDDLADKLGHSAANTSAHLQVLQQARLVDKRKEGRRVFYRLAGDQALRLWLALRDTGLEQIPEVREAMRAHANEPALWSDIGGEALLEKVRGGEVVLLDLRPSEEFDSGHIPTARSIPFSELKDRLDELDDERTVVAYCRGPYCVAAIKGVDQLRQRGIDARRLPGGVAEWRAEGLPVDTDPKAQARG